MERSVPTPFDVSPKIQINSITHRLDIALEVLLRAADNADKK